jgi:hypothetical protein
LKPAFDNELLIMNFQLGPMLHRRNNDAAVPGERQEERLGNRQATNSHRIVYGQPFGIGGKKETPR